MDHLSLVYAVYAAVGVRMDVLPMSPPRLFAKLQDRS